jgi:CheY-like chemotaxis protein
MNTAYRVLLIEDDESIRNTLKMALELEGYTVFEAENGEEGLALLPSKPDLILLDLMMPRMDGREFLERKKQLPEYAHIPSILLSAAMRLQVPVDATLFLEKPIDLGRLIEEVSRLLCLNRT